MSAAHHNRVQVAATARARAMEDEFAAAIRPVLDRAGRQAASRFRRMATNHLTAAGRKELRRADREALIRAATQILAPEEPRAVLASLALTAAIDVQSNSTMICVKPRPDQATAIADPDGYPPENLHCTLVYVGEVDGPLDTIAAALRPVAGTHAPLEGVVGGYGQFGHVDPPVGILLPDVPGLIELRVAVTEALVKAGIPYARNHGFEAHITVDDEAETDEGAEMLPLTGTPLNFDAILLVRGDAETVTLPLTGAPPLTAAGDADPPPWTAPAPSELVDIDALVAAIRRKTDKLRRAIIQSVMGAALAEEGIRFDIANPFAQRLLEKTGAQITNVAQTTQDDVQRIVEAAYKNGLSISNTAAAIRDGVLAGSHDRATLIARTELAGAANGASVAGVQAVSAITGTTYSKQWMTAPGAQYPRHETYPDLDGQTADLDGLFQVGDSQLAYPGDPDGDIEEIANCRCAVQYADGSSAESDEGN